MQERHWGRGKLLAACRGQNAYLMATAPDSEVRLCVSGLALASPTRLLADTAAVNDVFGLMA
jgi:hypothetical protein